MTENQITVRAKVAKTDTDQYRIQFLEPVNGMTEISNPLFAAYPNGTIVEFTLRQSTGKQRIHGAVRVVSEPAAVSSQTHGWTQVGTEWFSPDEHDIFTTATQVVEGGQTVRLQIVGPSGYGKTSRAKAWAAAHDMTYVRINCSMIRDPEEWFIYREARANENGGTDTVVLPTKLTEALQQGNALILLDEINRLEPWLANSLFPLLDFEGELDAHGMTIKVGPGVMFVMTKNEGHSYVGTFGMDAALQRRVDGTITVAAPPADIEARILIDKQSIDEDAAVKIVTLFTRLRRDRSANEGLNISTGPALKVAMLHSKGMSLRKAFQFVVINAAPEEDQKIILDIVNAQLGVL